MDSQLRNFTALELAQSIRKRQLSPLELMQEYIKGIKDINPQLNAFSWLPEDQLLSEAQKLTEKWPSSEDLPAFYGVPIPIKELAEVMGWPAHSASKALSERKGSYDLYSVAALRKAGFVLAGQTCSPEFGLLPTTESEKNGISRNPWNLERTCGGSSGGAAAAVSAGLAAIAHGSDGGGSIRIPASCCGLFGLKPSRGRISKGPNISEAFFGLSTDGVLTKSVADSAALLDILSIPDPYAWNNAPIPTPSYLGCLTEPLKPLKIAVCTKNPLGIPVAEDCQNAVLKAAETLAGAGHTVVEDQPDWQQDIQSAAQDFLTIWAATTAGCPVENWDLVEPNTRQLYEAANQTSSYDFMQALLRLQVFSRKISESWKRFDILLTPTVGLEPPACNWLQTPPENSMEKTMQWAPFALWFNLTGQPAASYPVAMSQSGLPIGVQIVAAPWREDILLQLSLLLEKSFPIHLAPTPLDAPASLNRDSQ